MSDATRNDDESRQPGAEEPEGARRQRADGGFELWTKMAMLLAAASALAWIVVLLRLGMASVYTHAFVISTLGVLTVPVMLWGLVKSLFNPPLVRRSRLIGFGLLLVVGLLGNVPLFAVPLSTADWESDHTYRLPFDGEWTVTAGGDSKATNYHATTAAYRWAYDFTVVEDGKRHRENGDTLEDHYCYGQPVLAATAGEVVRVDTGHADNPPGEYDPQSVLGNHVIIEVDDGEYLFVAHMKDGSVTVEDGEAVESGQKLGECGNSGRSVNPHVHVHLQSSTDFPMAEGLPLRFSDYVADGERVDIGMPLGSSDPERPFGQTVRP